MTGDPLDTYVRFSNTLNSKDNQQGIIKTRLRLDKKKQFHEYITVLTSPICCLKLVLNDDRIFFFFSICIVDIVHIHSFNSFSLKLFLK